MANDFSTVAETAPAVSDLLRRAEDEVFNSYMRQNYARTDRMFAVLMVVQFFAGIGAALWISPRTWAGTVSEVHPHVYAALILGGLTNLFPAALAWFRPGETLTRHVVAVGQVLTSALLIHLTGGRIETHFHVFGSLAFIAFYRDWKVLVPPTIVVAADHFLRGVYFPQSVYGILVPEPWRFLEHTAWVVFEDIVLVLATVRGVQETRIVARREVESTRLTESLQSQMAETRKALLTVQETQAQLVQSEKMASLGDLVAGVAHEINTPVGIGVTAASHLQDVAHAVQTAAASGALGKAQFERFLNDFGQGAEIILTNLRRAADLIRSFQRVAVDQSTQERRQINLKAYLEETLLSLKPRMKHTPHRVILDCPDTLVLDTVPGAISQILSNLVINSLVHGFIAERPGTVNLRVTTEQNRITLRYADDGQGIAAEHLPRIFDPFFTTRRGQGGTGLGLNIVFNLVRTVLGGSIEASSTTGQGAVFVISFPQRLPGPESRP